MTWGIKDREMYFNDGHTATVASDIQLGRDLHFSNGSGDDLYDAVASALIQNEVLGDEEEASCFLDPLEIIIREEELDM